MTTDLREDYYMTATQVRARFGGVSNMWLHRKMRDCGFPQPVRFGGSWRYWRVSELLAWERAMVDSAAPAQKRLIPKAKDS